MSLQVVRRPIFFMAVLLLSACSGGVLETADGKENTHFLVETQDQYFSLMPRLKPGDTVILKDGIWRDFEIVFQAEGKKNLPISLKAQTKGKVLITGESNLAISGNFLEVSGLVFKDGYSPSGEVISFRTSPQHLANNTRVTETVIDGFNNPERFETEFWVNLFGKNNRFDHNYISRKRTVGVLMAVRLDTEDSRNNNHLVDHNYFGPRPLLGSNGGEVLRIGSSHTSLYNSSTRVENNYFDRADGELEIVSVKSGFNTVKGNVFFESSGTLTLRHGNDNRVEYNVFFGNGKEHTGGIRLINARQTIKNNYMEGLTGYRLGGGFVVMNGVPNSPPTRYHQVKDSFIENNTLVNVDAIQLAAGADEERTDTPQNTSFRNNLVFHESGSDTFTIYDDVSGIKFDKNVTNTTTDKRLEYGFKLQSLNMVRASNGLLYPSDLSINTGIARDYTPVTKKDVGPSWYPKNNKKTPDTPKKIVVTLDMSLSAAVKSAPPGARIHLSEGSHRISKTIAINKPIIIEGANNDAEPTKLYFSRATLFRIEDGGDLSLANLYISGKDAPDNTGNAVIRTVRRAMLRNYKLSIRNCNIYDLDINRSFNVLSVYKGTMAQSIEIQDSSFRNISGSILKLDAENDNYGIYNAEYTSVTSSDFADIQGSIVDYYRGGTDESTFGPHFTLKASRLNNVGFGKKNTYKSSVYLHGVQVAAIEKNVFKNSKPIIVEHTVGEPRTVISNNKFVGTNPPLVTELISSKKNTAVISNNDVVENTDSL